jgi:hypothetical protein
MLELSEYSIDQVRLSDFDIYKTKYMKRTVEAERDAFEEKDIGGVLLLAGWLRIQGLGTMFATFGTAAPIAAGGTILLPLMLLTGANAFAPFLLSKKKYRKAFKEEFMEVAEITGFSAISVITSPIRHVIIPEKCYKRHFEAEHPFSTNNDI